MYINQNIPIVCNVKCLACITSQCTCQHNSIPFLAPASPSLTSCKQCSLLQNMSCPLLLLRLTWSLVFSIIEYVLTSAAPLMHALLQMYTHTHAHTCVHDLGHCTCCPRQISQRWLVVAVAMSMLDLFHRLPLFLRLALF